MTWRRDLWGHRVIVFWKCVKLLTEQLWQIWWRYAPPFFSICEKPEGGGADNRPPPVRGLKNTQNTHNTQGKVPVPSTPSLVTYWDPRVSSPSTSSRHARVVSSKLMRMKTEEGCHVQRLCFGLPSFEWRKSGILLAFMFVASCYMFHDSTVKTRNICFLS